MSSAVRDGAVHGVQDGGEPGLVALFESARTAVRQACDGLDADRLAGADAASLFEPVVEILRVATAAKLALASRIESSGVWRDRGCPNAATMIAAAEGVGVSAAASTLAAAGRLRSCPATGEALRQGKVSEAQARVIAGAAVVAPGREGELLEAAGEGPHSQLALRCRRVRATAASADPLAAYRRIHARRYLRHWSDEEGGLRIEGRFTPDAGARLVASLEQAAIERQRDARAAGGTEPLVAHRADALCGLVAGPGRAGGTTTLVHVRVDHAALVRGHPEGDELCEIDGAGPVPLPRVVDLMGDAGIRVIFHHAEEISRVFHFTRTINQTLATALVSRDPTCVVPGCGATRYLEIDHLVPFARGGPTTLANLARICSFHHSQKTLEGYTLAFDAASRRWRFDPPRPSRPSRPVARE